MPNDPTLLPEDSMERASNAGELPYLRYNQVSEAVRGPIQNVKERYIQMARRQAAIVQTAALATLQGEVDTTGFVPEATVTDIESARANVRAINDADLREAA